LQFLTDPRAWWLDPFTHSRVMSMALWAGLLTVLATSVVGTWVVLRGMSFLATLWLTGCCPASPSPSSPATT
jgi:hypothetical protein